LVAAGLLFIGVAQAQAPALVPAPAPAPEPAPAQTQGQVPAPRQAARLPQRVVLVDRIVAIVGKEVVTASELAARRWSRPTRGTS
jgi:hypothetical protein